MFYYICETNVAALVEFIALEHTPFVPGLTRGLKQWCAIKYLPIKIPTNRKVLVVSIAFCRGAGVWWNFSSSSVPYWWCGANSKATEEVCRTSKKSRLLINSEKHVSETSNLSLKNAYFALKLFSFHFYCVTRNKCFARREPEISLSHNFHFIHLAQNGGSRYSRCGKSVVTEKIFQTKLGVGLENSKGNFRSRAQKKITKNKLVPCRTTMTHAVRSRLRTKGRCDTDSWWWKDDHYDDCSYYDEWERN